MASEDYTRDSARTYGRTWPRTVAEPSLFLNFTSATALDPRITFTRATTATRFNSYGVLESVAADIPRIDYNPSTLQPRGLLIEEQRTNSIRNNTGVGAVAGTPGTLPTNWAVAGLGTLTQEIVGTGVENGINYIDIRFSGTTSTGSLGVRFDTNTGIPATSGQTWTASMFARLVAGTTTNVNAIGVGVVGLTAAGAGTTDSSTTNYGAAIIANNIASNRISTTRTLSDATTAYLRVQCALGFSSGVAIDITLRIGLPQLELGAFATSVIPTTTTALTRNADVATMTGTNFSSWYNASEGTLYSEAAMSNTTSTFSTVFSLNDNTSTNENRIIAWNNNALRFQLASSTGNPSSTPLISGVPPRNGTFFKTAATYATSDAAFSYNAGTPATGTLGTWQPSPNISQINIGSTRGSFVLNGHIQRIAYYPTRLPDATLQALTA